MSWHFSRALVAAYLADTCSAGDASAPLNTTPMPVAFYYPDKTTEHSRLSRFGMTSEPLTEALGAALLTSFLAASRAKTSALPEQGLALPEIGADYGKKCPEWFAKLDRNSSMWKTRQRLLAGGFQPYCLTWPRSGMMLNGECFLRATPVRHISGNESGYWPTPTVCGNYNRPGASATSGMGLSTAVNKFPTPCARDYRHPGRSRLERTGVNAGENLPQIVGGPLNPGWVEWLMGWPIGWTELKPLAMDRYQEWQQAHSLSYQIVSPRLSKDQEMKK